MYRDDETEHLRHEIGNQWQRLEDLREALPDGWSSQSDDLPKKYGIHDWELVEKEVERVAPTDEEAAAYTDAERYIYGRTISKITERIARYIPERNLEKLQNALLQLQEHASLYPEMIDLSISETIEDAVDSLILLTPTLIYEPREQDIGLIEIPKLVVGVNEILAEHVALNPELLRQISPRRFEELMAEIFDHFGYDVELTQATRDGGKDIIAISKRHGILSKTLIECKRYVPPNKVGVGYVRQLLGVKTSEVATRGIIVTTSYFTRDARKLEEQNKYTISLQDFDVISGWVQAYAANKEEQKARWVIP